MKRALLFLMLVHAPLYSLNVKEYVCNFFVQKKSASYQPQVRVISIKDGLDFEEIAKKLFNAGKDKNVDGIVLYINNTGGDVGPFSVLHDMIKKVTTIKPVISLIGGDSLSCGYMIASAANFIVAHTMSNIGNIGVLWEIIRYKNPKVKGDVEAEMQVELFYCGEFKTICYTSAKDLSDNQRKYLQDFLDETYKQFLNLVATNRSISLDTSTEWAEGKIFNGPQALQLGLIDQIGTMFDVETKMLELIKERNPSVLYADTIEFA